MDITCWNCKKVTPLNKAAIEDALKQMDTAKLGFHDVTCASCGKSNRTDRAVFEKGLQAASEPKLTTREETKKNKEERKAKRAEKGH
jgi:Fe-S cluster biogenesis protein NfuA